LFCHSYHKIGLLVLFVHDITDIWLELTKVLHYLEARENGKEYAFWKHAASGCFIVFTFCWYEKLIEF
jgi:ceramide synthetase